MQRSARSRRARWYATVNARRLAFGRTSGVTGRRRGWRLRSPYGLPRRHPRPAGRVLGSPPSRTRCARSAACRSRECRGLALWGTRDRYAPMPTLWSRTPATVRLLAPVPPATGPFMGGLSSSPSASLQGLLARPKAFARLYSVLTFRLPGTILPTIPTAGSARGN